MLLIGTPVTIRALKYDGREYRRWQATYSAAVARGIELEAVFSAVVEGRTPFFGGDRAVEYFSTDRGYNVIAGNTPEGSLRACYRDTSTPAQLVATAIGTAISFSDLDRDLLVWPDGRCELIDEAEFAQNSVDYGYPQSVQADARAAVSALQDAVLKRAHPIRLDRPTRLVLMPHKRCGGTSAAALARMYTVESPSASVC